MMDTEINPLLKIDQRALILNPQGEVLLVREQDLDWDLPGGLLLGNGNWRENLEDLIAEALEMQVVANNPVYTADYVDPESSTYVYMNVIQCDAYNTVFENEDYTDVKWFSASDALVQKFATYEVREALRTVLAGEEDTAE